MVVELPSLILRQRPVEIGGQQLDQVMQRGSTGIGSAGVGLSLTIAAPVEVSLEVVAHESTSLRQQVNRWVGPVTRPVGIVGRPESVGGESRLAFCGWRGRPATKGPNSSIPCTISEPSSPAR